MAEPSGSRISGRASERAALVVGLLAAIGARWALLPTDGLRGDLDLFALWTHAIATRPLGQAYRTDLNFGPVMALVYWVLGIVQPGFVNASDAADPAIRIALKLPAVIADAGLVAGVAVLLRDRHRWAIVAAIGIALSPAIIYVGAWWGQSDSIYVLAGLVAAILAIEGRPRLAAVALACALMTKPQALVFLPPLAAWAWVRLGPRGAATAGLVTLGTIAVLWLPFLADGGPAAFLATIGHLQSQTFAVLSLRAWNPWWILQSVAGGGDFLADGGAIVGPLSPRLIGYLVAGSLEIVIVRALIRDPSRRALLLGMAASVLVGFVFLTSMHERYVLGALVFLAPLIPERRIVAVWLTLTAVVTVNLAAAVPPIPEIGTALPVNGPLGIAGSLAVTLLTAVVLWSLVRPPDDELAATAVPATGTCRGTRRRTSGGSGAATSGA